MILVLAIIQSLSAVPVYAEWVFVDGNEHAKVYVDQETLRRTGDLARIWVMDDFKTVHRKGYDEYLSSRAQEEHDCSESRFRILALVNFSGSMGAGKEVYASSVGSRWAPIPSGSLAQSVWKFVCGRKR